MGENGANGAKEVEEEKKITWSEDGKRWASLVLFLGDFVRQSPLTSGTRTGPARIDLYWVRLWDGLQSLRVGIGEELNTGSTSEVGWLRYGT